MTRIKTRVKKIEPLQYDDYKISIDTLYIVAKLTVEELEFICDRIEFVKNYYERDKFYYRRDIGNITILTTPTNTFTNAHYNTMIRFNKCTSSMYIPYCIQEILQFKSWKIKRIDISFDFNAPFENKIIWKHHPKIEIHCIDDYLTDYVHGFESESDCIIASYDQNEKEISRGTGIEHGYATRYEMRLFPKLNKWNMLHRIDHGWIYNVISKYIFVPDVEKLPINGWDINRLKSINKDWNNTEKIKRKDRKKYNQLRDIVKVNRVPLEQIYETNKDDLFSFLELEQLPEYETFYDDLPNNDELDFDFYDAIRVDIMSDLALEQLFS